MNSELQVKAKFCPTCGRENIKPSPLNPNIPTNEYKNARETLEILGWEKKLSPQGLIKMAKQGSIPHFIDEKRRRNRYLFLPNELNTFMSMLPVNPPENFQN